jgi:hypothetical protein
MTLGVAPKNLDVALRHCRRSTRHCPIMHPVTEYGNRYPDHRMFEGNSKPEIEILGRCVRLSKTAGPYEQLTTY